MELKLPIVIETKQDLEELLSYNYKFFDLGYEHAISVLKLGATRDTRAAFSQYLSELVKVTERS